MLVLPQVGHDINSTPKFLSLKSLNISFAAYISSTGSPVRDTLIVSPIESIAPIPTADFIVPLHTVPASVMPTCNG